MQAQTDKVTTEKLAPTYECNLCKDAEFILDGWSARECPCAAQKRLNRRMKSAMIPEQFVSSTFKDFVATSKTQEAMKIKAEEYLAEFDSLFKGRSNSFGFIAYVGESTIREIKSPIQRAKMQKEHNNFGLGKTHLTVAIAKELIQRGYATLIISDVMLMEELGLARSAGGEDGDDFRKLIYSAIDAPVLVWDDLGKAKHTESREKWYYTIINARYEKRRPIIFSSNEDRDTLMEKIGPAAASRLYGMAGSRMYRVEGTDYRLYGA